MSGGVYDNNLCQISRSQHLINFDNNNEDNETGAEASVQFSNAKVKREDTSPRKRNKK